MNLSGEFPQEGGASFSLKLLKSIREAPDWNTEKPCPHRVTKKVKREVQG